MKRILVRYKVKESKVEENEALVKAVYTQLSESSIEGFHYCTLKLADGVSFIHIAFSENDEANTAFTQLTAFKKFQADIKERCEEPPVAGAVTLIGSHNFG